MKTLRLVVCLVMGSLALFAGDLKNQGEVNVFGGGIHINNGGGNKGLVGGSAGYGITSRAQLFGEYSYIHVGENLSAKTHLFTGGVKYNVLNLDRVEVYGLAGFGAIRATANGFSSSTDPALHLGGGARIYVGKNWGITPEIRYMRIFPDLSDVNTVRYTGGIFFRWGAQ